MLLTVIKCVFDATTINKELILNIRGGGVVCLGVDLSLNRTDQSFKYMEFDF